MKAQQSLLIIEHDFGYITQNECLLIIGTDEMARNENKTACKVKNLKISWCSN